MPSFAKMFDNLKLKVYEKYSENPAALCIFTGALGWALSCLAQVGAVVFNDKLSPKDKTFLVPQEIADGAINVGLFLALTTTTDALTKKAIESGKIMFSEIKAPLSSILESQNQTLKQALAQNKGKISEILKNTSHIETFKKLKGGTSLVATLLASIVSCNILTPIARNIIGARWQKKLKPCIEQQNYINNVLTPIQPLAMKLITPSKKLENSPYKNFYSSSGMRV